VTRQEAKVEFVNEPVNFLGKTHRLFAGLQLFSEVENETTKTG